MKTIQTFIIRILNALKIKQLLSRFFVIALPYGWHILFFLIPFFIILKISLSESALGIPPIKPLCTWQEGLLHLKINMTNFLFLIEDSLYFEGYMQSLSLSFTATLICLIIGYPMAYGISKTKQPYRTFLLLLVILPFWTSFLVRIYSWMGILNPHGLINTSLLYFNIIQEPLDLIHNDFAVCLGIVYSYLPFMILPLYAALEKLDGRLLEAAHDLGAHPFQSFLKITWPLSRRGVFAGALLVFIPGVGEFVIPELLGGSDSIMIGKLLWNEFFLNRDWPLASSLAIILLVVLVCPIFAIQKMMSPDKETFK